MSPKRQSIQRAFLLILLASLAGACAKEPIKTFKSRTAFTRSLPITDGGSSPTPSATASPTPTSTGGMRSVIVKWAANRETAVNTQGGGYRVYYSTTNGFSITGASVVTVSYNGDDTPTQATLSGLAPGTYYFRVIAFTSLGTSAPSDQKSFVVP